MAAKLSARSGSPLKRGDSGDLDVTHEINVTPFIDVMLVLLMSYMVAAPLATVDIGVELPATAAERPAAGAEPPRARDKPVFVTVKRNPSIAVGEDVVARVALRTSLDSSP